MTLITRKEWNADNVKLDPMPLVPVKTVVLHHTATPASNDGAKDMRNIEAGEQARGYTTIAYHEVGHPNGLVYEGRGVTHKGAATLGRNSDTLAYSFIGNFQNDTPTPQALEACAQRLAEWVKAGRLTKDFALRPHSDFFATACLPLDETELLTPEGWKPLSAIKQGDLVAQWDKNIISFVPTISVVEPYEAEVTKVRKSEMTDNHRVIYRQRHTSPWSIAEFQQINSNVFLPGSGVSTFNGLDITDEYLRFLVWVQADGHYKNEIKKDGTKGYHGIEFHLKKDRKIQAILGLLDQLEIPVKINEHADGTTSLSIYGGEHVVAAEKYLSNKNFTWDWLYMNMDQFEIFWNELLQADGCMANSSYSSSQKINTEIVQAILVTHGRKSHIYSDPRIITGDRVYSQGNHYQVGLDSQKRKKLTKRITYVGCVEVPSGAIVVRQYGQAYITGNCCGNNLKPQIPKIWNRVKEILNSPTSPTTSTSKGETVTTFETYKSTISTDKEGRGYVDVVHAKGSDPKIALAQTNGNDPKSEGYPNIGTPIFATASYGGSYVRVTVLGAKPLSSFGFKVLMGW